ncbi:MAG: hypothetical protein RIC15_01625 [Vicingaceae bacterium]
MKFIKSTVTSDSRIEMGASLLSSVKIVVNVLFALVIFQAFLILPRPDDPDLEYFTLSQIFQDNIMTLLVIVVGMILVILYWIQFNRLIGNLKRSTPMHASLSLMQVIFLMLYLYFMRFDIEFDGMKLALQMESVFLALAGFTAAINWMYARSSGLISKTMTDEEKDDLFYKILPEPLASAFTFPFAVYGPDIWTIAFLSIIPFGMILKRIRKKNQKNKP